MKNAIPPVVLLAFAAGCGGDPVSYSQPVGITFNSVQKNSVTGTTLSVAKDVNTESGNPYAAFVSAAVQHLSGKNPSRIAVTSLTLELDSSSTGVTALQDVFAATPAVTISFLMNTAPNNTYEVGHILNPTTAGPVSMTVSFDSKDMTSADYAALVQGQFKVVLSGPATSTFATGTSNADMKATFGFVAYE